MVGSAWELSSARLPRRAGIDSEGKACPVAEKNFSIMRTASVVRMSLVVRHWEWAGACPQHGPQRLLSNSSPDQLVTFKEHGEEAGAGEAARSRAKAAQPPAADPATPGLGGPARATASETTTRLRRSQPRAAPSVLTPQPAEHPCALAQAAAMPVPGGTGGAESPSTDLLRPWLLQPGAPPAIASVSDLGEPAPSPALRWAESCPHQHQQPASTATGCAAHQSSDSVFNPPYADAGSLRSHMPLQGPCVRRPIEREDDGAQSGGAGAGGGPGGAGIFDSPVGPQHVSAVRTNCHLSAETAVSKAYAWGREGAASVQREAWEKGQRRNLPWLPSSCGNTCALPWTTDSHPQESLAAAHARFADFSEGGHGRLVSARWKGAQFPDFGLVAALAGTTRRRGDQNALFRKPPSRRSLIQPQASDAPRGGSGRHSATPRPEARGCGRRWLCSLHHSRCLNCLPRALL